MLDIAWLRPSLRPVDGPLFASAIRGPVIRRNTVTNSLCNTAPASLPHNGFRLELKKPMLIAFLSQSPSTVAVAGWILAVAILKYLSSGGLSLLVISISQFLTI
jgi:hypothetical protein